MKTNKKLSQLAIIGFTSFALTACGTMPTEQEMLSADYGTLMAQAECEANVKVIMQGLLKDPESARYEFGTCERKGFPAIPIYNLKKQYGYFIPVQVNSKNSYGAYAGATGYGFLFKDGEVLRKMKEDKELGAVLPF